MVTWERNFPTASKRTTAHIRRYANGDQRLRIKGSQKLDKPGFSFSIQKAKEYLTHTRKPMSKWTDEEISILKENYASKQIDALLQLLPSKTVSSIYHRAFELRLRKPSRPRPEKPGEAQKSNGETQPQKVKTIEQPRITKILPYERQVILELGKFLPILELKMLLPRRSAKEILQLLDYYHMH